MSLLVLDASVAAKWFLPGSREPLKEEALSLLRRHAEGEIELIVPDLFWAEFGNILWKAVRTRRLVQKSASEALMDMLRYGLPTVNARELTDDALAIALATGRTVYDAIYVALAVRKKCQFVTADERLVNTLATHWPVKWLGAL